MKTVIALALVLPSLSFAASKQFQVETRIFIDGQLVSSPRIVVLSGEPAEIAQISEKPYRKMAMKVLATDLGGDDESEDVMMRFDLEYTAEGGRTVKSSPQILAKAGEPASIKIEETTGETFQLDVRAVRK